MRTVTTTVYKFDELSDNAKEKARDWYRNACARDDFFSECVIDDAKEALRILGYSVKDVFWSGFSSQGDGACFTGSFAMAQRDPAKLAELRADRPTSFNLLNSMDRLDAIATLRPTLTATLTHRGRGNHEQSVSIDVDAAPEDDGDYAGDDDKVTELAAQDRSISDEFDDVSRDLMRDVYRQLEAEYEFVNSDEQVDETIRINEYEFTEEGYRA